jgi:1,4-alpha-glucan branching enzyme
MITKSYSKTGGTCRVTFKIPAGQAEAQSAVVLGEFNSWNADATPMKRGKDGSWSASVTMATGRPYRFRYLLDGTHWANDDAADAVVRNDFGSKDSVVSLDGKAPAAPPVKKTAKAKVTKPAKSAAKTTAQSAAKKPEAPKARKEAKRRVKQEK